MRTKSCSLAIGLLFAVASAQCAWAQHGHEKEEEHGKPADFKMPTSYKGAVKEIEHRLHEINELIEGKHLDDVHAEADVIKKIGEQIGQLALKADSGVPKEAVKDINQAGKALAGKFDAIDKAGDAGDAAGTRKVYDEMVALTATLKKYVAKTYACPMKDEGAKTYDQPGKCPKCGMALKEVAERGEHGGILLASADEKHQVEATLSAQGELRLYAYDEHEKPLAANKFTAECKACKRGGADADSKSVAMTLAPDKAFLSGKVDASLKSPLTAKATIDFKDGGKPQAFTFDFDEPTQAPSEKSHGEKDAKDHKDDEHKGHKP